ncbi:MlaD family protein [Conexibacter sp. DBS9H8]|uniref:MlaD family protein n=1 Tax=Conexibacter sp. DBS9H8 TaxID=2937801 RepID=UPI00200E5973|nr:MlaD family protein [Conexibacter sp. DBS9H8]
MRILNSRLRVEMRRARREVVLLAIGIVAGLVAIAIIISKENVHLPWQGQYTAQIAVSNADGVVPGLDEVRWAGIVVGRITAERFNHGEPVLTVELATSKLNGARLYRDAQVQLRPATPLDDMYLDVVFRGHPSAGLLGPNQVLQASQTQTPVNIADVLDTFSEPIRLRLQELLDELATGLSPAGGSELRTAYGTIAQLLVAQKQLSDVIDTRQQLVKSLVHNSGVLFSALNARNTELGTLVHNGGTTLAAIGSQSGALGQTIAELPGTLTDLHNAFGQLQTTLGIVRPALTDLLPTARALPSGLRALRRFSAATAPALAALDPAVTALVPLARNLPGTATALKTAFSRLLPQAPELNHVTSAIVPCELPVDKFFAWSLSLAKFDNASNLTASPRGNLTFGIFNAGTKDPLLTPVIGCADGQPAPTSPQT